MALYPFKFKTIYKEKLWGGQKIRTILGKDFGDLPNCGETWEISGVRGNISEVANGPFQGQLLTQLIEDHKGDLLGERVYQQFGNEFPLLIKFIDANADLSIQVHPGDELAKERHGSFGKTEMWYIFQADEGSKLVCGFNQEIDKEGYLKAFKEGRLMDVLNQDEVKEGDVYFLPAGRIHTIGKGILLAEIQQTSDITYRIYDFDRVDINGNKRELHVEQAIDAIDYSYYERYDTPYEDKENEATQIANSQYFDTNKIAINAPVKRDYLDLDSFVIHICFEGSGSLKYNGGELSISKGDAILIPASVSEVELIPDGELKLLETYLPQSE